MRNVLGDRSQVIGMHPLRAHHLGNAGLSCASFSRGGNGAFGHVGLRKSALKLLGSRGVGRKVFRRRDFGRIAPQVP